MVSIASLTMTNKSSLKSPTLVPLTIAFHCFKVNSESNDPPSFSWLPFEGAAKYKLNLLGSQGIIWNKEIIATEKTTITYDGKTTLQPEANHVFTVEIEPKENFFNQQTEPKNLIVNSIKEGIDKIRQSDLSQQFKAELIAQLDSFLIANYEIHNTVKELLKQGSNSEVICFLNNFLEESSPFEMLANACSSDDILEAMISIANRLASAYLTLSDYLAISSVLQERSVEYFDLAIEFAFLTKGTNKLEAFFFHNKSDSFTPHSLTSSDCQKCSRLIEAMGRRACRSRCCRGCEICFL